MRDNNNLFYDNENNNEANNVFQEESSQGFKKNYNQYNGDGANNLDSYSNDSDVVNNKQDSIFIVSEQVDQTYDDSDYRKDQLYSGNHDVSSSGTYKLEENVQSSFIANGNNANSESSLVKKKKGKFFKKVAGLVVSAAVFGLVAGASFQFINQDGFKKKDSVVELKPIDEIANNDDQAIDTTETTVDNSDTIATSTGGASVMDVSSVVENVMPAIVAINSSATQTEYDFFGRSYDNEVSGSGSGIIIGQSDSEILIVTNNHVIDGATAIEIVFDDDTKAIAELKGTEPSSDLAVVAVDIDDLSEATRSYIKIARLGDSDGVKTGELAIAIGNALGYGQSVTVGYISALDREVTIDNVKLNLLQTDAAINPGNSGGALLNASGEVIGINSVKYSDTSVEGIGYAIPISEAIPIVNELMNREVLDESESAYLGISAKNIDDSYAQTFNMPLGVYVYSVAEGSPAEAAGLHQGDIITAINDKEISEMQELVSYLSYTRAETKVELTVNVLDNGSYVEKTIEVTLGYRPVEAN